MFIALILIAIGLLLLLAFLSEDPKLQKGKHGEELVKNELEQNFPNNILLNNITLPYKDHTTQIDHMLFTEQGIFVIETKNLSGFIKCNKKWKYWYQKFDNGEEYPFYNPLRQNWKHLKVLENLGIPFDKMFSVVVMIEDNCSQDLDEVTFLDELVPFILSKHTKTPLSKDEINRYYATILSKKYTDNKKTDKLHIRNLKKLHN